MKKQTLFLSCIFNLKSQSKCVNGTNSISPGGITIKLPLTTNTQWKNPYYPTQSTIDTCYTLGEFENLQLNPGYLKCISFMALGAGNTHKNEYWYNKSKGLTKIETYKVDLPDPNTIVRQTSTLTLTKFN